MNRNAKKPENSLDQASREFRNLIVIEGLEKICPTNKAFLQVARVDHGLEIGLLQLPSRDVCLGDHTRGTRLLPE